MLKINKAIRDFRRTIPKSQDALLDQCDAISKDFIRFAKKHYGITARLAEINLYQGELDFETCHSAWASYAGGKEHCISHYAVLYRNLIIDFTYKQFDEDATIPVVERNCGNRVNKIIK